MKNVKINVGVLYIQIRKDCVYMCRDYLVSHGHAHPSELSEGCGHAYPQLFAFQVNLLCPLLILLCPLGLF